jgi:hypothetical protein
MRYAQTAFLLGMAVPDSVTTLRFSFPSFIGSARSQNFSTSSSLLYYQEWVKKASSRTLLQPEFDVSIKVRGNMLLRGLVPIILRQLPFPEL